MSVRTSLGPADSPLARANFWGQGPGARVDTAYARGCRLLLGQGCVLLLSWHNQCNRLRSNRITIFASACSVSNLVWAISLELKVFPFPGTSADGQSALPVLVPGAYPAYHRPLVPSGRYSLILDRSLKSMTMTSISLRSSTKAQNVQI